MTKTQSAPEQKIGARQILTDPLVGPIIVIVFILLAGLGLVFPVLPLFARSFGVGNDGAGLFIGAFGFARLFGDLIGGTIVDRKGERWTAIAGLGFLGACCAATGAAPNFPIALVTWALAGVGSAIIFASLFSYILKAAPSDRAGRTLSFFYGAFNVGVIAGGAIGGVLAELLGLRAPLFGYTVMTLVGIAAYVRFVPDISQRRLAEEAVRAEAEAAGAEAPRPSGGIVRELLRLPGFATALLLNLSYLWIVAAIFNTLVPLFATDELHLSTGTIGIVFAVGVAAEFFVLFPAGTLSDRYGRKPVMVPSLIALIITTALVGTATSALTLSVLLAALAIASGFAGVPPAAMLSDVVPQDQSGRGVGAFRFMGDIGFFVAPILVGWVSKNYGFDEAFWVTTTVPVIALLVTLRTRETLRPKKETLDEVERG
jgi:MFS family permease